ncbi:GNAT family N-acetyltransferase [Paenibacillus sp. PK3_47]|uniref:GNAT family N-acetyltransferase n=1 Tax=Paenibacillus sp. PK3_47 TaxID=2072642 RepID=UPI00201E25C7|nr:GNAT family N-acetyltransferase [Paenibacillus sp. PK3_47]UQZ37438.1 GNAT family N-acetyltransferase [Paenibacillus sp. PK3_47]
MNYPVIETDRLSLRLLTLADREAVFRHFSDEEVTRYMDIPPCRDIREADGIIRFHMDDPGCRWGIFDKRQNQLAGTCGYHCWSGGPAGKAEIGFDLSRACWGKGMMTEALLPVISFGYEVMGLKTIEATVDPENERSLRLLSTLGFSKKEELVDNLVYFYMRQSQFTR